MLQMLPAKQVARLAEPGHILPMSFELPCLTSECGHYLESMETDARFRKAKNIFRYHMTKFLAALPDRKLEMASG